MRRIEVRISREWGSDGAGEWECLLQLMLLTTGMALVPVAGHEPLSAIVEVFNDEPVVDQSVKKTPDSKRTPIKVRRIDTYFRPITSVPRRDAPVATESHKPKSPADQVIHSASAHVPDTSVLPHVSILSNELKVKPRSPSPDIIIEKKHPFIPPLIRSQKEFNRSIDCRGCHKIFLCHVAYKNGIKCCCPEIDYYNHCYECESYRRLDLMMECNDCYSVFLDTKHYDMHLNAGGGSKSQGCRVNAERNFLKYGCKTTVLDTSSHRYFDVLTEPKPEPLSPGKSSQMTPVEKNGILAIDYSSKEVSTPSKMRITDTPPDTKPKKKKNSGKKDEVFAMAEFRVFVPPAPPNCRKTTVPCEGCGTIFGIEVDDSNNVYGCKQLYEHCIFSCPQYRKGLDDEASHPIACLVCMTYFMDHHHFKQHKSSCKKA